MTSRLPFLERWVQEGHFDIYFVFFKRRSKSDLFRESSCFLTSDELTWPWRFVYLKTEIKSFILIFTFQNINQVLNFVRQRKVILGQKHVCMSEKVKFRVSARTVVILTVGYVIFNLIVIFGLNICYPTQLIWPYFNYVIVKRLLLL